MIRAIRLEIHRPIDESWEVVGPHLRLLAKATPKLLNAAMDARIAIEVAGRDAVKSRVAPDAKAASGDGLAYQAVLRAVERLQGWGLKKKNAFANLEVPGGMSSAIARAASQAFARRDQERARFASERVLVRKQETSISRDERGVVLAIGLRAKGDAPSSIRFAIAHSRGAHHQTLRDIVAKSLPHGDCKLQWDERRKKWYALLSYELAAPVIADVDPGRTLVVHRGARNALYLLTSTGQSKALPGGKFIAQRRALQARMRDTGHVSAEERGDGAKGHGRARRYEFHDALGDKLARVTHTFCQQAAAFVATRAKAWGCGLVVIEDYGGIEPNADHDLRRVLDRFPLYEMKQCIASRTERDGLTLREVPSAFISTTCPCCKNADERQHNTRTGIFHCRRCEFQRPADWVASFWMLSLGGGDMTWWHNALERERKFREATNHREEAAE